LGGAAVMFSSDWRLYALDVGRGQLHDRLRRDPRVVNIEGMNAREIPDGLIPVVDWIVTDVSFISLEKALPVPLSLARKGAVLVALVKPQFEVGRKYIGKGGIVRDQVAKSEARDRIEKFLQAEGWQVIDRGDSPIKGGDGNEEYLVAARRI